MICGHKNGSDGFQSVQLLNEPVVWIGLTQRRSKSKERFIPGFKLVYIQQGPVA